MFFQFPTPSFSLRQLNIVAGMTMLHGVLRVCYEWVFCLRLLLMLDIPGTYFNFNNIAP